MRLIINSVSLTRLDCGERAHVAATAKKLITSAYSGCQVRLRRPWRWEGDFIQDVTSCLFQLFAIQKAPPTPQQRKKKKKEPNNLLTTQELTLLWAQLSWSLFHLDLTQSAPHSPHKEEAAHKRTASPRSVSAAGCWTEKRDSHFRAV